MKKLLGIALTLALLLPGMALAAMSDGAFLELAGKADAAAIAKALTTQIGRASCRERV